jgi:hypothetical protein
MIRIHCLCYLLNFFGRCTHGRGNMFVTFADKLLDSSREPRLPDAVHSNFRISPDRAHCFLLLLSTYRGHTTTLDPYCSGCYHLSTLGLSVPHRHETSIITTPIYEPLGAFFPSSYHILSSQRCLLSGGRRTSQISTAS